MPEEIKAYKTSDSKVFTSKGEALDHEAKINAIEYFNEHGYYGDVGDGEGIDIVEFIDDNKEAIKEYLNRF